MLQYQARLRLPDTFSHSQKMQCVDHIIEVLDLATCQDTSEYTDGYTIDGSPFRMIQGYRLEVL